MTLLLASSRRLDGWRCRGPWEIGVDLDRQRDQWRKPHRGPGRYADEAWQNAVLQAEALGMAGQFRGAQSRCG
jgi:hypothetical protein